MKAWTSSKAVPSPSPARANKYPPPLMRFLRTDAGSRSRRRSSRPTASLFAKRKRTTAIDAFQEPSSPKVTCIGQVRVRRSCKPKKKGPRKRKPAAGKRYCCRPGCFRPPPWRKWVSFFRCRKFWVRKKEMDRDCGEEEERAEERKWSPREVYGLDSSGNPPKNALILSRCRSAPYRSSYLARSPFKTEEDKTEHENSHVVGNQEMNSNFFEIERIPENAAQESEVKGNAEIFEHLKEGNSAAPRTAKGNSVEVEKTGVLRRSKSEPGRRSGDPLTTSFWTQTTLESLLQLSINSVDHK